MMKLQKAGLFRRKAGHGQEEEQRHNETVICADQRHTPAEISNSLCLRTSDWTRNTQIVIETQDVY